MDGVTGPVDPAGRAIGRRGRRGSVMPSRWRRPRSASGRAPAATSEPLASIDGGLGGHSGADEARSCCLGYGPEVESVGVKDIILPGAKSFIVRGKGNAQAYCSCSHGAGRRMSRTQARKLFTQGDLATQTAGVECRRDDAVIDEIPSAYKDIDAVMAAQSDLVDVVATLKQILCVKG